MPTDPPPSQSVEHGVVVGFVTFVALAIFAPEQLTAFAVAIIATCQVRRLM